MKDICGKQAWYIPSPHRPDPKNKWYRHYKEKAEYPLFLYEVKLLESSSVSGRFKLEIIDILWEFPGSMPYSPGSILHLPERDIFYSKEEAIQAHKKRISDFMVIAQGALQKQINALVNYDNCLSDSSGKYISPFTGEEK